MIPGVEEVPAAELRVGDCVWVSVPRRASWAMVIALGFDLDVLVPAEGFTVVFDDGHQLFLAAKDGDVWRRSTALVGGHRPEDIARAIEHAEKTLDGLQKKIARLRRLQGLVDVALSLRERG